MPEIDYSTVTETPGLRATREQLSAVYTRYRFAAEHVEGKDVLEVACGVGNGLGYLAGRARRVVGGDIEEKNLAVARDTYAGQGSRVKGQEPENACRTHVARSPAIPKSRAAVGCTRQQPGFSGSRAATRGMRRSKYKRSRAPTERDARPVSPDPRPGTLDLLQFDAENLPFDDDSFDVVLLFEALYYLRRPERFLREARRVLRPGGKLLISTVHPEWPGFHPSPHSVRYFTAAALHGLLEEAGFNPHLSAAFPVREASVFDRAVGKLRRAAVRLGLIPRTMRGKVLLKRLFYGRLAPLPTVVSDGLAPLEPMTRIDPRQPICGYKFLYARADNEKRRAA